MRLLILDEDEAAVTRLEHALRPLGHHLRSARTVADARKALLAEPVDIAILQEVLLDIAPFSFADFIHVTCPEVRVVLARDPGAPPNEVITVHSIVGRPLSPLAVAQVCDALVGGENRDGAAGG